MLWYIHPHSLVPWEWLYQATIYTPQSLVQWEWLYHAMIYPPHSLVPWEWFYALIYPPPLSSFMGVIISCHDISTPTLYFLGSDYIMPQYIHPHSLGPWELLYNATIYPPPLSSSMWVIALCDSISTPLCSCMGITLMIIMPWCISTSHKILDWLWWHYLFTPDKIWWGGEYIVNHIFIPDNIWRGWLYPDIIFSLLTIFGEGLIISWHYIFIPDNIWWGSDYIVTSHFHSWQYLVRGWLYHVIIFSLLTIFGGGEYIVTLYFHSWQYLVRGWLYRVIIFSLLTIFGGGKFIVTLYFLSWQYLVRGWLYRDITFSFLTIFGEGVIISWHYISIPDSIWWGDDYIMTLHFHSWHSPRIWHWRWLYLNIFTIQIWLCSDTRV